MASVKFSNHPERYSKKDDNWVINYSDNGPIPLPEVPDSFRLENLIEVSSPR